LPKFLPGFTRAWAMLHPYPGLFRWSKVNLSLSSAAILTIFLLLFAAIVIEPAVKLSIARQ
jgi:hypothetical protein